MRDNELASSPLLAAALQYREAGLCVLPAHRNQKRPALSRWKEYQTRLPEHAELSTWFGNGCDALCLIAGSISGQLELLDFDRGGELFEAWSQRIPSALFERLVIETSQSGGWHVIYRSEEPVSANLKLARQEENDSIVTLIETRGNGGLFLCVPTPGYELIQGNLAAPPVLTAEERETLLLAAWELNAYWPPSPEESPQSAHVGETGGPLVHSRPGDDFNARGDVAALLEHHGWHSAGVRADGNQHWTRPGKKTGTSATLKDGMFYVFSSNAHPFESQRAYSAFAVYALLEHGGDFESAARALSHQGYGQADSTDDDVNLSGILYSSETEEEEEEIPTPELPDPGPLPEELLRVPGFISEVMDHCLATAPYPNLVMAFSGGLALQAFLAGRKVRDAGDNRTNLYLLALAHSASGKDWPRKLNTRILHEVGYADCLGERFASGEGIQDALFTRPCMLFQTDEIDGMLQAINMSRDGRYENMMSTLLTLYSSANSVYPMRRKAGRDSPGAIDQPCLTILGTAIPNHYYQALSNRMLTNGFFARMLILESGPRSKGQEPEIRDLPPRVLETARWWCDFLPGTGNLENWHPVPAIVDHTPEARQILIESRERAEDEYAEAEGKGDAVRTTVWGRVSEQTRKLALLYAVSVNHGTPQIDAAAAAWADQFVMHQTQRMLFMVQEHAAESEFDSKCKQLLRVLREWKKHHGDEPMQEWQLNRKLPWKPRDHEDVRISLTNRKLIDYKTEPTKTKPKKLYWLL